LVPEPVLRSIREYGDRARAILGSSLVGVYLHGSIALDAFDDESSDVDFVTAVHEPIDAVRMRALAELHSGCARRFDGVYLAGDLHGRHAWFSNGRGCGLARLPAAARRLLARHGVCVLGPPSQGVFADVTAEELEGEMRWNLDVYWRRRARSLHRFLFDEGAVFALSTIPRILHTLETGEIISKPQAIARLPSLLPEAEPLLEDLMDRRLHRRHTRALSTARLIQLAIARVGLSG
jgi:hypothetical protein